jgi:hypothetical protein
MAPAGTAAFFAGDFGFLTVKGPNGANLSTVVQVGAPLAIAVLHSLSPWHPPWKRCGCLPQGTST